MHYENAILPGSHYFHYEQHGGRLYHHYHPKLNNALIINANPKGRGYNIFLDYFLDKNCN